MSLEKLRFLSQTIQIATQSARDADGVRSYGSNVAHKGRWEPKAEEIKDRQGEIVNSRGIVYIDSTWTPSLSDRITLPDSTQPRIIMYEAALNNKTEVHHYKVWVI
jgi:hypothetical protein